MNHNFNIMPFVRLNLLTNGKPTYISIFDICQIYEDTSRAGKEGVQIIFKDDSYTFVEGPLDSVMYAIDEALNPEFYKEAMEEESRPAPGKVAAIAAARILRRFCVDKRCCDCIFCKENGKCGFEYKYPICWILPGEGEKK